MSDKRIVKWMRSRALSLNCGAALLIAVTAMGCANFGAPATPEELVMARAQQRWNHLIKGDYKEAYGLFSPSYRGLQSFDRYRASLGAGGWKTAEAKRAVCEPEKCVVTLKIELELPMGKQFGGIIPTYLDETWVLEKQQWWLHQSL